MLSSSRDLQFADVLKLSLCVGEFLDVHTGVVFGASPCASCCLGAGINLGTVLMRLLSQWRSHSRAGEQPMSKHIQFQERTIAESTD